MTGAEVIHASRVKAALALLLSAGLAIVGVLMVRDGTGFRGWLVLLFFGAAVPVFGWSLWRPQRLLLDADGFELSGGLMRRPSHTAWRDVEGFFVFRLPRGGTMIGYNYTPEARARRPLARISRQFGADGALPKLWHGPSAALAERLETWRVVAGVHGASQT